MTFDLAQMRALVAAHGPVVRVVVAEVAGSAPREVGASLMVWAGGQAGTIGGGALELEAVARARALDADRIDRIPLGPALGQCCGGAVTLLSEVWDEARLSAISGDAVARGSGPMPPAVRRLLGRAGAGAPPCATFAAGWMVEPLARADRALWIFGAGHVGRALVDVIAPLPGIAITWIDTAPDRFPAARPGVTQVVAVDPADMVRHAPGDAEHLVLTYSHAMDLAICHRLLGHGFGSAGVIGSATKWARFRKRLRQLGHCDASISRICCPIGRPELGKHPQAIAVGVAAALLLGRSEVTTARDSA